MFTKEAYDKINEHLKKNNVKARAIRPFEEMTIQDIKEIIGEYEEIKLREQPPTSEEVCKALSEYFINDFPFKYDEKYKWFTKRDKVCVWLMPNGELNIAVSIPANLIAMIGRFYEDE